MLITRENQIHNSYDDNNNNNNNNNNILSEDSDCWECSFKEAFYSCPL